MLILSAIIVVVSVVLDQVTKYLAVIKLKPIDTHPFIPKLLELNYETNKGVAFGMLQGQRWIFIPTSLIAIGLIAFIIIKYRKTISPLLCISLSMIAGGGIGNQIDRLVNGYVVDFLNCLFIDFPVFNVGDSFVPVGCALALISLLTLDRSFLFEEKKVKTSVTNGSEDTKK